MVFPITFTATTVRKDVVLNPVGSGKIIVIDSVRIANEANTAYTIETFIDRKPALYNPTLQTKDELDAGDYILDDTPYRLSEGFSFSVRASIPETVVITINGHEEDI
jgi:hypothetical protein